MTGPQEILSRVLYSFAPEDLVRSIQAAYVRHFTEIGANRVLDLGCGRGLFLELLREVDIETVGVDRSEESVSICRQKGFSRIETDDLFPFLRRNAGTGQIFDGIFCSHLIEHLDADQAAELLHLVRILLSPGGRVILVTPNISNLEVWTETFWLDPTHVRPYPRPLLESLIEASGMRVVRSFADRRTARKYGFRDLFHRFPRDFLRFGSTIFQGKDSVVIAERTSD